MITDIKKQGSSLTFLVTGADSKETAELEGQEYCDNEQDEEYMVMESSVISEELYSIKAIDINR